MSVFLHGVFVKLIDSCFKKNGVVRRKFLDNFGNCIPYAHLGNSQCTHTRDCEKFSNEEIP